MNLIYCNQYRKKDYYYVTNRKFFSVKFKSGLVIELLKGEKALNTIAAEITFNQIFSVIGRKNSLIKLPWSLAIHGKKT